MKKLSRRMGVSPRRPKAEYRCTVCGIPGHNYTNCQVRRRLAEMTDLTHKGVKP